MSDDKYPKPEEKSVYGTNADGTVLLNLQNLSGRQVRHDIPFDMNARTGNGIGISKRASGLIPSGTVKK